MDTKTLQNQLTAIRASDGELERRLSELDAKLGAWLAVVQAGHAALLALARRIVPSAVPREAPAPLVQPADPSPAPRPPSPPLTDEALLQTLDRETAQAIRVKRRLCDNGRSVQQLLEEYRAAQAQQQARQQSKPAAQRGWWRRKND
jgi:hypothetical protein